MQQATVVAIAAGYSHSLALAPSPGVFFHNQIVTVGANYVMRAPIFSGQQAMLQWYHNGALVHLGNTLSLTNLQAADLGQYVAVSQFTFGRFTNTVINLRFVSDLQVVTLNTPLEAWAGFSQPVNWTVANRGHEPAVGSWVDRVYLSDNATVGNDTLIGDFPYTGSLATNQALTRNQVITIPANLTPDRDYWWVVVTDSGHAVEEENEQNNVRISDAPMRVHSVPAPNLRVASVSASANLMSSQPVTVTWAVTNAGAWSTGAGLWQDAVYLSTTTNLNGTALLLGRAIRPRSLSTNDSYASSLTVTLPQGLSGTRYFIVKTDADNRVNEGLFENDNTAVSAPMTVTLTPPPDLQVTAIQAPTNAVSGTSLSLSYTVTNAGPGVTAETVWVDNIYLSPTNALDTNAVLLGSFSHEGMLTNGQTYNQSASVSLPASLGGVFYLLVFTDARNDVFESVYETNNIAASAVPIVITLTPPPDLAVSQIVAPSTAMASHELNVSFVVTNCGTDTSSAFFWEDRFYLTTNVAVVAAIRNGSLASAALFSGEPQFATTHFGDLPASETYTNTFTVTVPDGLSGTWYAVVETDSGGEVFELVRTNNLCASDAPIFIESRPADLVVTGLTSPSSAQAGSSIPISWAIRNQGAGDTVANRWSDRLVLSADAVAGNADDATLLTLDHAGLLAAGGSYAVNNQVVMIPYSVAPGSYHLFLLTDSGNAVYEGANEGNNASLPSPLAITRTTADLRVTVAQVFQPAVSPTFQSAGGSDSPPIFGLNDASQDKNSAEQQTGKFALQGAKLNVLSEDTLVVSWRVENMGVASPNSTVWSDAIYLSTNSIWDTNAVLLGVSQNPASLAPGTFYTNSLAVTLPAEIQGDFFIHVVTDADNQVIEISKANNTLVATNTLQVTLRPVPDLAVVSVATPADGFSGQLFELSWSVTNCGSATAEGIWYDSVYLSLDPQFEPDLDTYIGYAERPTPLTNGQSYTQTALLEIPNDVSGLFYVFVVCDSTGRVNERGGITNNVGRAATPVSVWLKPPSDLVVGTITIPTNVVSGYEMALTYVLRNQGTNAAFGPWADAIYLSADDQWDISDTLFTRISQDGFLAVGGNRTNTVSAPTPGVLPGDYHVIIRTDIVNQVPETNEFNNITATLNQTVAEVEELTLNVPSANQIATRQARYYRVHVTSGQWLVVELNCASSTASTELFVRYGAIPTRSEFDFIHSNPLQPNQRIVVPNTKEGDYYILAYGDMISAPGSAAITLTARLSQFMVFDTSFGRGGNAGNLTIPFNGVDFDRTCTVRLTNAAGLSRPALSHYYESGSRFYATLDLRGLAHGIYTVAVQNGNGATVTIPNSLEVVAAAELPTVIPMVSAPSAVRQNVAYTFTVQWGNNGSNDASAPLLTVGNSVPFGLKLGDDSLGSRYTFLGINTHGGPPGILRPGQSEIMTFYVPGSGNQDNITFTAYADRVVKDSTIAFDWESLVNSIKPATMSREDAVAVAEHLAQAYGATEDGYLNMLSLASCATWEDASIPATLLREEVLRSWSKLNAGIWGVIDSAGTIPDRGFLVSAVELPVGKSWAVRTDRLGRFFFSGFPDGTFTLNVEGYSIVSPESSTVQLSNGISVGPIQAVVAFAPVVTTQIDLMHGSPVRGATASLWTNSQTVATSQIDENGIARFSGVKPGVYFLIVAMQEAGVRRHDDIRVQTGGSEVMHIDLATAVLRGTIPDDQVMFPTLVSKSEPRQVIHATCTPGAFRIEAPRGEYQLLVFDANGDLLKDVGSYTLNDGDIIDVGSVTGKEPNRKLELHSPHSTSRQQLSGVVWFDDPNVGLALRLPQKNVTAHSYGSFDLAARSRIMISTMS